MDRATPSSFLWSSKAFPALTCGSGGRGGAWARSGSGGTGGAGALSTRIGTDTELPGAGRRAWWLRSVESRPNMLRSLKIFWTSLTISRREAEADRHLAWWPGSEMLMAMALDDSTNGAITDFSLSAAWFTCWKRRGKDEYAKDYNKQEDLVI